MALETALKALLSNHAVCSWKITGDGPNPCVILRLRAENEQNACMNGVHANSVTYRRKPPSQILRDRRRVEDFRQKRENENENATVPEVEPRVASQSDIENELNTEIIESAPSEICNTKVDSAVVHTSPNCATDNTERAPRNGDAETATHEDGGHGSESSDMETDINSDQETTDSETECKTLTESVARDLVKGATSMQTMLGRLKQEDRNNSFDKVVIDCRGRGPSKVLCVSQDLIATWEFGTEKTNFQLRPEDYYLPFWYDWPDIPRYGAHKDTIDKLRTEMKAIMNRIREMI